MRKNSPRRWLHAILDLLPVIILPIFALAVRSDNNFQPIEVQTTINKEVNFNQLLNANYSNYKLDYFVNVTKTNSVGNSQWWSINSNVSYVTDHVYYIRIRQATYNAGDSILLANNPSYYTYFSDYPDGRFIRLSSPQNNSIGFIFGGVNDVGATASFYINLIDLTFMYGEGNEPTQSDFDYYYQNDFYNYTTYKKEFLPEYQITLNDTDVGSQMVYTLYNATDKYFNFNNVFNFGQIYDWFVLNIFNGNPSLIFPVVWNIVLYEFIMDLVFLIYSLFMFFVDFCTNLIDRFHVKCSGGK